MIWEKLGYTKRWKFYIDILVMLIFIFMIAINSTSFTQGYYTGYENGQRTCYKPIQNITGNSIKADNMNIADNNNNNINDYSDTWSIPKNDNNYLSTLYDELLASFNNLF